MNHYVYILRKADEYYIGVRTCYGDPLLDPYMGSGARVRCRHCFAKTVLAIFDDRSDANELEAFLVDADLLLDPNCLNLKEGGTNGLMPAESRIKMSEAHTGVSLSAAHKAAVSAAKKGVAQSAEHVANASAAKRGMRRNFSDEHRARLSEAGKRAWANKDKRAAIMGGR